MEFLIVLFDFDLELIGLVEPNSEWDWFSTFNTRGRKSSTGDGGVTPVALFLGAFVLRDRECGTFTQPDSLALDASRDWSAPSSRAQWYIPASIG